jgi:hypothetical protein
MDLSHPTDARPAECASCYLYQDGAGRWHWEGVDAIGAVVAHSNRGFDNRAKCFADALTQGHSIQLRAIAF